MNVLIWPLALIVSAIGGYYVTRGVLRLAQRRAQSERNDLRNAEDGPRVEQHGYHGAENPSSPSSFESADSANSINGPDSESAKQALRGGMWIGILERALMTGFILSGFTAGIAVVVAIKGLGRYPELNANTSERFIIGTLTSLLWACLCGWGALYFT